MFKAPFSGDARKIEHAFLVRDRIADCARVYNTSKAAEKIKAMPHAAN